MKSLFALLLCIAVPVARVAAEAQSGYKVTYDGGSLGDTKAGAGMKIIINSSAIVFTKDKNEIVSIPPSAITEIRVENRIAHAGFPKGSTR